MAVFTPSATSSGINFDTDFGLLQLLLNQANYQAKQPGSFYVDAGDLFINQLTVSGSFTHVGITTGNITSLTFNDAISPKFFTIAGLPNLSLTSLTNALAGGIQDAMELIFAGSDTIQGTANNDYLAGYDGVDTIYGNQGKDTIHGNAGTDYLYGGEQDDTLYGDSAIDYLYGGAGNDRLYGGSGLDDLDGGSGVDTVDYASLALPINVTLAGANFAAVLANGIPIDRVKNIENVTGGSGADQITGDAAANTFNGNGGDDKLNGADGNDTLLGGSGLDTLRGGNGNDTINGDNGNDQLFGDAGNDTIKGGANADTIDGGAGIDTASYTDKSTGVTVTLNGATGATVFVNGVAEDTVKNVENLTGGSGNDSFIGDALANALSGGNGNDALSGGLGNDSLSGGNGDDTVTGGFGNDVLAGGAGADKFVFDVKAKPANADRIVDFDALDMIVIDTAAFMSMKTGALKAKFFHTGKKAKDGNDYFIFNDKTDELFFDKDGQGGKKQKLVASFDADVDLTAADFLLI